MLTSIEYIILNNKLNLLKREMNCLTICCFFEQSIKDIIFYHQNFNNNIFYEIFKNKKIFDIFYFLQDDKNSVTMNFEKIKKILIFFKIFNKFSEEEIIRIKEIFKKRNIFAHEQNENQKNIWNEDREDFFIIFNVINLLVIETNKILFIKK